MLTPLDIHNKVFSRAFRGYRMEEVDAFLDEIIRDQETYFRENKELKDRIALLEEEMVKSREVSSALEKTMLLAQRVHDEESSRAKREADVIIHDAENKGDKIIQEAEKDVLDARQRIEHLRLYEKQLYLKHKGFLEFQMELLDGYKDKELVLTDSDMDKLLHGGHERDLMSEESGQEETLPDVVSLDNDDVEVEIEQESEEAAEPEFEPTESEARVEEAEEEAEPEVSADEEKTGSTAGVIGGFTVVIEPEEIIGEYAAGSYADVGIETDAAYPEGQDEPFEAEPDSAEAEAPWDDGGAAATEAEDAAEAEAGFGEEAETDSGEESPFIVNEEAESMEKVVLLAQKMEEALKALDDMYGSSEDQ